MGAFLWARFWNKNYIQAYSSKGFVRLKGLLCENPPSFLRKQHFLSFGQHKNIRGQEGACKVELTGQSVSISCYDIFYSQPPTQSVALCVCSFLNEYIELGVPKTLKFVMGTKPSSIWVSMQEEKALQFSSNTFGSFSLSIFLNEAFIMWQLLFSTWENMNQ